jgi:hypothetical protein
MQWTASYTIEERHHCRAPRWRVWEVLQELPAWPEWDPYIVSLARADGRQPLAGQHWVPGTRWVERVRRGPFTPRFRLITTALTPGRYVEWSARYLGVTGVHGWDLSEEEGGCLITSRETFSGPAPLIWPARGVFRLFRVRPMTRRQLAALAEEAEGGGPHPSGQGAGA